MSIFRDSFLITFSKSLRNVVALVFIMFISRLFSEAQYGTYRQAMLIASFLNLVFLLGIPDTINYYYRNLEMPRKNQLISNTILIKLVSAIFVFIALVLGRDILASKMNNPKLSEYIIWIAILSSIIIVTSVLEHYYIASGHAVMLSIYNIILYILYYICAVIVAIVTKHEFFIIISVTAFESIKMIIMFIRIFRAEKFSFSFNFDFLVEQIKFALPLGMSSLMITFNRDIDKLMISNIFTPEQFATYNNASMNLPIVDLIAISVGSVLLPRISQVCKDQSFHNALAEWREAGTNTALILYPLFFVFFTFPQGYISFIFSEKYMSSSPIFQVYLLKMLFTFTIISNILLIMNKKHIIFLVYFFSAVGNVVLNLVFIRQFGMIGAAISTSIVEAGILIFQAIYICKVMSLKPHDIFTLRILFLSLIIPIIPSVLIKYISTIFDFGHILNFFIYGGILGLLILTLYVITGLIKKEYIEFGRKRVRFFLQRGVAG